MTFDVILHKDKFDFKGMPSGVDIHPTDGTYLLSFNESPSSPIRLLLDNSKPSELLGRLHFKLAPGVKVQLWQEMGGANSLTMNVLSTLGSDSELDHVVAISESAEATHISNFESVLEARSQLRQTFVAIGGKEIKMNVQVDLIAKGATSKLSSLSLVTGEAKHEMKTHLKHLSAETYGQQLAKNLVYDGGRASFTGRVFIAPGAQKVESNQMNRNLLMGKKSHAIGRPELEIFADDVKCGHGSSTGRVEEDALFYLLSRGIPLKRAQELMSEAFMNEVTHQVNGELRDHLQKWLSKVVV